MTVAQCAQQMLEIEEEKKGGGMDILIPYCCAWTISNVTP